MTSLELTRPDAEAHRLAAVRRYDILDTPPDGSFDRITALAARLFSTPISIISLVDTDRIWFKSAHGLDAPQVDRSPGLCASAILDDAPYLLTDAAVDPRSLANPLVAGDFGLRFYLGIPLRTHDGFNLGTLCVIDREPRTVSQDQIAQLEHLASIVIDQMELRLSARAAVGELSLALAEKDQALARADVMAREIDHRVMNSLQFVSSLLALQSRAAGNPEVAVALDAAAARVATVGRVHRHFYLDDPGERTDALLYLERLCGELSSLLNGVTLEVVGEPTQVPTAKIMALGLVVNELVTNAAKHGAKRIQVSFGCAGGPCRLCVSDDGPGLPKGFDPGAAQGLGMRVIAALARQLGGDFAHGAAEGGGACFTLSFD